MTNSNLSAVDAKLLIQIAESLLLAGRDRAADAIFAAAGLADAEDCGPTAGTWDEAFGA